MREKKELNQRIGTNIKAIREEAGYTQEGLSELLNVTPHHLSAVERGVFGASLELIDKLCRLLHVSADRLLFGLRKEDEFLNEISHMIERVSAADRPRIKKILSEMVALSVKNK